MKKQLIITSVLALGMGIAGAQTQTPAPMQSEPGRGTAPQQQTSPASAAQVPGAPINSETAAPQSFKGCLNGSPGNWSLSSDDGKNLVLSGTDDKLSPYKGQEVRIQGTRADDGTVKIDSIDRVSTSCPNQTSSSMSTTQSATTSQPASSTESSNQANTAAPATTDNSAAVSGQSTSTTGTATPPVSNQTPTNTVGSGQTEQSTAQPSSGNAASGNTTNQNAASTGGEQKADQGVKHFSDMDENAGQKLPQTASPLPLLGLLGLSSLAGGLIGRRKR
jgi:LPXTG-motif cell wall-anchored protein